MAAVTPGLAEIYAPVASELAAVEVRLKGLSQTGFPHLSQLLAHSLKGNGKRIRPALTLLCGQFYEYDVDRLVAMATAVEVLHTATLVHDDAIDHSLVRRSRPTVNQLWGEEQAVLLGDYLFAEAGALTATTDNLRVIKLFAQTLKTISSGELDQAVNTFTIKQSREQYIGRIARKTATLFATATESGSVLSHAPEESIQVLIEYGYNLGIAFQIVDDVLDFVGTPEELGKPVGSDLVQGTVTLPLLLAVERYPQETSLKQLFLDRADRDNTGAVIDLVRNSPEIVQECYRVAAAYCERASRNLHRIPMAPGLQSLTDLACYVVRRKK
jgi:heptaprenyl diphosphate synthase/octaprenyl-diphosphate synthase